MYAAHALRDVAIWPTAISCIDGVCNTMTSQKVAKRAGGMAFGCSEPFVILAAIVDVLTPAMLWVDNAATS